MRFMKKAVAFAMAVMLVVPSVTAMATDAESPAEPKVEVSAEPGTQPPALVEAPAEQIPAAEASTEQPEADPSAEPQEGTPDAEEPAEQETSKEDTVQFQIGETTYTVTSAEPAEGDDRARFAEDGSYTIDPGETELTFPLEVEFTCGDTTEKLMFDTADAAVVVGGKYTFKLKTADTAQEDGAEPEESEQKDEVAEQPDWSELDLVQYNTGTTVRCVVGQETVEYLNRLQEEDNAEELQNFMETFSGIDGEAFDENGNYTITLMDESAFFPYEVQFTCKGETTTKWFDTPDSSVEVGGHTFTVAASENTTVSQMSLEVAGKTIVVRPEAKEFTDDGGIQTMSLIPLKTDRLTVDLTGFTPVELTMVSIGAKFTQGGKDISGATKIAWKPSSYYADNYMLSGINDQIDLSCGTSYGGSESWEMIVGDGDQLNSNNIRYTVTVQTTASREWLTPQVYVQDTQGNRLEATMDSYRYGDYYSSDMTKPGGVKNRYLNMSIPNREWWEKDNYLSLTIKKDDFTNSQIQSVKYVEGYYATVGEAVAALTEHEVTAQVQCGNMEPVSSGYKMDGSTTRFTMLAYNSSGDVIGYLPFRTSISGSSDYLTVSLYEKTENSYSLIDDRSVFGEDYNFQFGLTESKPLNGNYTLVLNYNKESSSKYSDITSVYIGQYESVAQAVAAGATEIKDTIFGSISDGKGYTADFSQSKYFTAFAGEDSDPNQAVYSFQIEVYRITPSEPSQPSEPPKDNQTELSFSPYLKDEAGNETTVYIIRNQDDSYAEENYITMLVPSTLDLSKKYAPSFSAPNKATVYTAGASAPEKSGESFHLLNSPIQYTVNAENGTAVKNYWLQVKKADTSNGALYVNSLTDANANTRVENGVTYSTREMMLDGYHDYHHDICFANVTPNALTGLSAELSSSVLDIDPYWTLNGQQSLAGMSTTETPSYGDGTSGQLSNLAKVRLRAKAGVADGTDITGTLTIKSNETVLMVLTLTGVVGDPCITTKEVSSAVKYVPYGSVIQNSNKYSWIHPSYELWSGKLPAGMEIRPNGELYGVPQETGSFTFTVEVRFVGTRTDHRFSNRRATLTLTVNENTNDNVYYESDIEDGYILSTPIGVETAPGNHDFYLDQIADSLFVSEGSFDNFIDLWLNGEKLVAGVDYAAVSGSTRITVSAQTMQNKAHESGNNTIAAEFRANKDLNNELKRTAQNFHLDNTGSADGSPGGSSSGNGSGRSGHSGSGGDGEGSGNGGGAAASGVTIRGRLVDASNNALSGMTVELHSTPRTTVTNSSGMFEFANVEYGPHNLFVKDAAGNVLASTGFELIPGSPAGLAGAVVTVPDGSVISLTVTMANGGLTLSNLILVASAATGDGLDPIGWMLVTLLSAAALAGFAFFYRRKFRLS